MLETALIGRHPHLPFWQWEEAADFAAARAALAAVGLDAVSGRAVDSLSGGERRRLDIATLLTQDAAVCLLDEPSITSIRAIATKCSGSFAPAPMRAAS